MHYLHFLNLEHSAGIGTHGERKFGTYSSLSEEIFELVRFTINSGVDATKYVMVLVDIALEIGTMLSLMAIVLCESSSKKSVHIP